MESKEMNEQEVAVFLQQNPTFFENHGDLLAIMHVPSLHGKGAVSLAERQQVSQRDKILQLERKYSDLLKIGIENDEKTNKVHQLTLGMLNATDLKVLMQTLLTSLREDFNLPHLNIKLWATPLGDDVSYHEVFEPVDAALKSWVLDLEAPYCGPEIEGRFQSLFDEAIGAKSYAVIPLGKEQTIGFLAFASEDEKRFYLGMGTLFLERLKELLTSALGRYLN